MKTVREVQRHPTSFLIDALFKEDKAPPLFRRLFYPFTNDIRNISNAQRSGNCKAPDDQENLELNIRFNCISPDFNYIKSTSFMHIYSLHPKIWENSYLSIMQSR